MQRLLFLLSLILITWSIQPVPAQEGENPDQTDEEMLVIEKKPEIVRVPTTYGSSRLRNWFVLDNRNLVIEIDGGNMYQATLMSPCRGLRFTDSLGFATNGPFELDKWITLYLPDGERCFIRELKPYRADKGNR